jgi:hypothetical protein
VNFFKRKCRSGYPPFDLHVEAANKPVNNMREKISQTNLAALVLGVLFSSILLASASGETRLSKVVDSKNAAAVAIRLWIRFPATVLTGSGMWENVAKTQRQQ